MEVQLMSVSPVSFMMAKEGDLVKIKRKAPKLNEFRGTLEAATESFLIFKGETKIGMIPKIFVDDQENLWYRKKCRIVKMLSEKKIIIVEIY
jgi:hypothetical protein